MAEDIDWGARAQEAADKHLSAVWTHFHEEAEAVGDEEFESTPSPARGPFDGCQTCEVREILEVAYPLLRMAMVEEMLKTLGDLREHVKRLAPEHGITSADEMNGHAAIQGFLRAYAKEHEPE